MIRNLGIICFSLLLISTNCGAELCDIETGQSNVILDINESLGTQTNQSTRPKFLPVLGSVDDGEIELNITTSSISRASSNLDDDLFKLTGKELQLTSPLDRDHPDISTVILQVSCTNKQTGKRRNIPVIIRISDVNDSPPVFTQNGTYSVTLPEDLPLGGVVTKDVEAKDADAGINALVEYRVVPAAPKTLFDDVTLTSADGSDEEEDGYGVFEFASPHQPVLTLKAPLDYESVKRYRVIIIASDRAFNAKDRLSSTATLAVEVTDADDQGPVFRYSNCPLNARGHCITPTYTANVVSGVSTGVLSIRPERIQAVDPDTSMSHPVRYSLTEGSPGDFHQYFEINPNSGWVRQVRPIESSGSRSPNSKYELVVRAEEVSEKRRFSVAVLRVDVLSSTTSAVEGISDNLASGSTTQQMQLKSLRLVAESLEGFVEENSPVGTLVTSLRKKGEPLQIKVLNDLEPGGGGLQDYLIELTTTAFRVNSEGFLEVALPNLDRDPPNPSTLNFQAVGRGGSMATPPVSISVRLTDVNDNVPRFQPSPSLRPVFLPAGDSKRIVTQVRAEDRDWTDNGRLEYSLLDVSPAAGRNKFVMNAQTGVIDAVGGLRPGEKYQLTVRATDSGGRFSDAVQELVVVAGPNQLPPVFPKESYDLTVSEGASPDTLVYTFQARDPENESVRYSIVSGNELGHFKISSDGASGRLLVASNGIDREELSRYSLTIRAEDAGSLSSSVLVTIRVLDVNDRTPEFMDLPYVFRVRENDLTGYVGRVHAMDGDVEHNGQVSYSLPSDSIFVVNSLSGEIRSKEPLDYEKDRVHQMIVTARDGGAQSRSATATVTVVVLDLPDESPKFDRSRYEANVPENGGVDTFVARVQAIDADGQASVTYAIRRGDADKFSIDGRTGDVRTKRPLDFERQIQHVLVIGTVENTDLDDPRSTTTLVVNVQDRNDFAPLFGTLPSRAIRLQNTATIGQVVATVSAVDADGTSPNNIVRYELVSSGSSGRLADQFFRIDPETGIIMVRDDLRKDSTRQFKLDIRAYDLGKPPLSTQATVTVLVDQVAPSFPSAGLLASTDAQRMSVGFSEMAYSVSVSEDALVHTLIKNLSVLIQQSSNGVDSVPADGLPAVSCDLASGNELDMFYIKEGVSSPSGLQQQLLHHCELRLKRSLDYEAVKNYGIVVRLKTADKGAVEPDKSVTRVDLTVLDVNDNSPRFVFKYPDSKWANGKYYAAVSADAPISSVVTSVSAEDEDSGQLGQVVYDLMEETNVAKYFSVERATGTIRTDRAVQNLAQQSQLPIRLIVTARDNPGQLIGYRETHCQVVVNVLEDRHRLVLVLPSTPPEQVYRSQNAIVGLLQDETKLIVRVEKLQARSMHTSPSGLDGAVVQHHLDISGSELWFYCVDPGTETILSANSSRLLNTLLDTTPSRHLIDQLASQHKLDVSEIRPAGLQSNGVAAQPAGTGDVRTSGRLWDGFPAALVVVGVLVFLLALGGIVYICATWDRIRTRKPKRFQPYVVFPSYNPVLVDPNPKEYETQILQLSVNNSTDESEHSGAGDLKMLDHYHLFQQHHQRPRNPGQHFQPLAVSSGPAGFQLMSGTGKRKGSPAGSSGSGHSTGGHPHQQHSSGSSADIATLRISSLAGSGHCEFAPAHFFPSISTEGSGGREDQPTSNPLYEGSDEDPLNYTSATNTNVTFRNKLARLGIPEASTEL